MFCDSAADPRSATRGCRAASRRLATIRATAHLPAVTHGATRCETNWCRHNRRHSASITAAQSATISGQIDESHRGNINFWATSWWGPGSAEDTTTRNFFFPNARAGELKYAVYPPGRTVGLNHGLRRVWERIQANGSTTAGVDALADQFQTKKQVAKSAHVGFVPAVSPGFNDSAVRTGHPAAPRYLTDVPGSAEGSLFSAELSQAALPNLDPAANNMLMVSTFNEWHEDTQIEPTVTANPTSVDSSGHGTYAQGNSYPGYGSLYLDLLHTATLLAGD